MSYDIYLHIDTGAEEPMQIWDSNYTSNVARMWRHAGVDLRDLNGKPATECVEPIASAAAVMAANPATYIAMNPENRWGDYWGALRFLEEAAAACREHSKATFGVWA
ncbi:hypothetical protein ACIRON_02835 [Nocardioides sp. NPDC101246]|uniref:hypothetical protein n=1 Tax=Nocardioides sp. NPDC101246 TaxID=3364336 RepID=UPI00381D4A4F